MSSHFAQGGDRCGWPQVVLFDLDGTLIDSVPDIAAAVNDLLATEGKDALSVDEVRMMIGNGVRKLVERAFAARDILLEGDTLSAMTDRMMGIYGNHLINETTLMPGAEMLVTAYARAGVKIGVVTNKPEGFARTIVEHFGLGGSVHAIVGGDTGPARKPAPDMLLHALELLGFGAHRALMVGDSPADIEAAKAAPMASIAVRGGYTTVPVDELGADVVIDDLTQVPQAIERLKEPV
ncbi:phosphoglycolate phosphatase [Oricola indica]|uniref:phosphoglycolate phosphatase n=1 Tax=Oricola indica TaxID=2872591 RepID=UPI003CCB899D